MKILAIWFNINITSLLLGFLSDLIYFSKQDKALAYNVSV